MEFVVQVSHKVYSEATIKASSLNEAYEIAIEKLAEGELEAEFVRDTDEEIDDIREVLDD